MQFLASINDITEHYDAFLLDLWGVIHDGQTLYPGVRERIFALHEAGKKIIFLSNAPRRAHKAAEVLAKFGIDESLYDHVITSGEAMAGWLQSDNCTLGNNYYFIGPKRDKDILDGFPHKLAGLAQCDWILNVGYIDDSDPLSNYYNTLETAASMKKIMICANPDIEVVRQNGERLGCAGEIAAEYERRGGYVKYFGKPYGDVYTLSLSRLEGIDTSRVVMIGDSLHTDIKGANDAGINSVLITGGILKNTLHPDGQENIDEVALSRAIEQHEGATPTYTAPSFG